MALAIGAVAWALISARASAAGLYFFGQDFSMQWRAADAMLRGYSPYVVINAFTTAYPFCSGYLYMLPTAVLLMPFGWMTPNDAMALFEGISVAVFAWALMRDGYGRLPLLLSAPLYYGAFGGTVVPLVTAAFLVPSLGFLAPLKFTTGAVGWFSTLSRRYAILAVALVFGVTIIYPWWPAQWWAERTDVAGSYYHVPLLVAPGMLLALAALRWRRSDGRLVLGMACLPQTMLFYDQLPLVLIARTFRESLWVAVVSWLAPLSAIAIYGAGPRERVDLFAGNAPFIVALYYLPAMVLVLRRPNVGVVMSGRDVMPTAETPNQALERANVISA